MTATAWGDPAVAQALREVVHADDGPPRLGAEGLREALAEQLGDAAPEHEDAVSALVAAAEAGIPQGVLDDVPAIDLGDRLDEAGLEPRAAGWALATWGHVLQTAPARITPQLEARPDPVVQAEETTPLPRVEAEILTAAEARSNRPDSGLEAEPEARPEARPDARPDPDPTGPRGIRAFTPQRRLAVPVGVLVAVAALLAIGLAGVLAMTVGGGNDVVTTHSPGARPGASPSASTVVAPASLATPLAHAGGREQFPLQTQAAMLDAARRGDVVEADLRWTLDNVPILYDAASVSGRMVCAQQYAVALTSWRTLKSCQTPKGESKDGKRYGIPAFDDTVKKLAAIPGVELYIELKVDQTPAQLSTFLGVLRRTGMTGRTVVTSFQPDRLAAVRRAAKSSGVDGLRYLQFVRDAELTAKAAVKEHLWGVGVRHNRLTETYLGDLHSAGLKVVVWTLNKPELWAQAREAGVDGVLTDTPAAYRAWYARAAGATP
ncbi:glycerophosphodiester phosphodiesterase [Spongisporangium articulatum]|uniref:Glycerophosphodiester phosphodiesterase n=1 Tax=Spongisporangium articulatum TaxID=3362603 RepID=A0ABW8AJ72_9ACTN